jgi:hypothetical protein
MATSKEKEKTNRQQADEKEISPVKKNKNDADEEIYSDGSGEAFEQTEEVNEDNFDDLKEK